MSPRVCPPLLLLLLAAACSLHMSVWGGPCASTLTFSEARAAAGARADRRLYSIHAGGPHADGRAEEWILHYLTPGPNRRVLVSCDRVVADTVASTADPAHDGAMADAIERWGGAVDSPRWMVDARWPGGGGYIASNVNDCSAPPARKAETPSSFFCAPGAEKGALLLARHIEPSTQPLAYSTTGLELWPTHRTVELREEPDAPQDGGTP